MITIGIFILQQISEESSVEDSLQPSEGVCEGSVLISTLIVFCIHP